MTAGGNYRTRRSALTFATGVLGTAATLAIAFVTTPLLLRWLGDERYGAFRATADWFGYLTLLELGLGGALAPLLAMAVGRQDTSAVRRTMAEGIRAYTLVAAAAATAGFVITLVIRRLVPVAPALGPDLRTGCLVATILLLLYPLAPFRILADASQRGWFINAASLLQSLITTTAAVLLAWRGFGIKGQFMALVVGQVVLLTVLARDGLKRYPGLLAAAAREPRDAETRAQIHRLNVPTLLFDLAGRTGLLTDNIVIALVLGPAAVAPLFLTQRLLVLSQIQLQGIGNSSWAALGQLHALGRRDVFNARLVDLTRVLAALSAAVLIPIAAYNHVFVRLWVGDARFGGHLVTTLAAINAFLIALTSLWGWCFSGTGQVATLVPVMLAGAALNLGASIAGARLIGLPGPLLGTCLAITVSSLWYLPMQLHRRFGTPLGAIARAALFPLLWAALPAAAIIWFAQRFPPATWPALALHVFATGMLLLGVWWFGELRGDERAHYGERIRMALPGRTAA